MSDNFKQNLYDASLKALTEGGVPEELAIKASQVVANDDASRFDLGRSPEDQHIVNQAMVHYWANQPEPLEVTE
ncbi:hypothetical protein NIES21_15390 [Anabaenopsis circularis NIES-21]|uniref:Uncharacterized protein n=1 Tax=Anabaenopsis circularis NIES-21 TaxID=1085406 RepID=A0A1Z4GDX7_9CYAN|nr:hypothetical protein NIES21_15390 [Anabaenopsis circularis NIES-21]